MGLVKKEFTSSGSWVAPSGVTEVIVIGYGGGGSGSIGAKTSGSGNLQGGGGGGGSLQSTVYLTVVPNTTYTITIGAGGAAPVSTNNADGLPLANPGLDTTFGSLATFRGAGASYDAENTFAGGGISAKGAGGALAMIYTATSTPYSFGGPGYGGPGSGYTDSWIASTAGSNPLGYAGGTQGATATRFGGGGGGGGPGGVGGNGSAGSTSTSSAGGSAAANTGAGGGGSGAANTNTGNGGAGGSGKLWVVWVDG